MQETWAQSLGWEDPLEKEMSTHPSILAWEIPRTEEPGGPEFMGSQSQTRLKRLSSCNRSRVITTELPGKFYSIVFDCLEMV